MRAVGTERGEGREACLFAEVDTGGRPTLRPASTPRPLTPEPCYQHPPNPLPMGGPTPATRLEEEQDYKVQDSASGGAGREGRRAEDEGVEAGGKLGDIVVGGERSRGGEVVVVGLGVVVGVRPE